MACRLCGVPQIANITGLGAAVENGGLLGRISTMIYKIGLCHTRLTFCQNRANLEFCQKHSLTDGDIKLLPGSGVNLQYHAYTEYPANTEPVIILFCGRIRKEKGIEQFLDAAVYFKEHPFGHLKTEFHIVGECEEAYEERLQLLTEQGVITYFGKQSDVRLYYRRAAITVLPSFYPEGMSNVLLESQATGRPVVTTNRVGCGETVENGVTGFIVLEQDSDDVIAKLTEFLEKSHTERAAMGLAARKKMEQELVVEAYLKAINNIEPKS